MKTVVVNFVAYDVCVPVSDELVDDCVKNGKFSFGTEACKKLVVALQNEFDNILEDQLIHFEGVDIVGVLEDGVEFTSSLPKP